MGKSQGLEETGLALKKPTCVLKMENRNAHFTLALEISEFIPSKCIPGKAEEV